MITPSIADHLVLDVIKSENIVVVSYEDIQDAQSLLTNIGFGSIEKPIAVLENDKDFLFDFRNFSMNAFREFDRFDTLSQLYDWLSEVPKGSDIALLQFDRFFDGDSATFMANYRKLSKVVTKKRLRLFLSLEAENDICYRKTGIPVLKISDKTHQESHYLLQLTREKMLINIQWKRWVGSLTYGPVMSNNRYVLRSDSPNARAESIINYYLTQGVHRNVNRDGCDITLMDESRYRRQFDGEDSKRKVRTVEDISDFIGIFKPWDNSVLSDGERAVLNYLESFVTSYNELRAEFEEEKTARNN